ncbi:hypothetical protein ED733_008496 [Metarhizium rileyi]|uniref:DNA mismatch repair protein HSM3 N-terminal domain-containing protein n=1 Tax=Metarhizium rileyi (strain RCEF 4871) TaxID=1649241 RepID=A0A5C6GPW9_METRR|nr:hypothetical protein ED733_008496 [Metarhizium rileyi]
MDDISVIGLPELQAHLELLLDDPSLPLDMRILDDFELQLTEDNIPSLIPILLPLLIGVWKSATQDPTALHSLTIKLLSPLSFTEALTIADPPSVLRALVSRLPGANLLALAILHKAVESTTDVAILALLPEIVETLVTSWLTSPDVGVGRRASKVLGDLLETDCEAIDNSTNNTHLTTAVNGSGAVNHRVPGDGNLWRLFLSHSALIQRLCTPGATRTTTQATISQGRLLRLLARLCTLNIRALSTPVFHDFGLPDAITARTGNALLQWAALGMVDPSDELMCFQLLDFFETFVSLMRVSSRSAETDDLVQTLLATALESDDELETVLRTLPDRTVEAEAEPLRQYIAGLLNR